MWSLILKLSNTRAQHTVESHFMYMSINVFPTCKSV
uniref:Uncharacterized protein n=1 Tax=Arundo donax TaxID=35708 RepID=A0A0A8Y7V5_ARUDO